MGRLYSRLSSRIPCNGVMSSSGGGPTSRLTAEESTTGAAGVRHLVHLHRATALRRRSGLYIFCLGGLGIGCSLPEADETKSDG